jgi:hypothetical protein
LHVINYKYLSATKDCLFLGKVERLDLEIRHE